MTNWTRLNKRDKVWSMATSLFKWRFGSRHRPSSLNWPKLAAPSHQITPYLFFKEFSKSKNLAQQSWHRLITWLAFKPQQHCDRQVSKNPNSLQHTWSARAAERCELPFDRSDSIRQLICWIVKQRLEISSNKLGHLSKGKHPHIFPFISAYPSF